MEEGHPHQSPDQLPARNRKYIIMTLRRWDMAHSPGIMLDSQVKGRFRPVYCQEKRDICRTKKCQSYDPHKQKCNLLNIELN